MLKFALYVAFCIVLVEMRLQSDYDCPHGERYRSKARAYYPDIELGGFVDMHGSRLKSVQEFLAGEAEYVTLSLDSKLAIPTGTRICIPEINRKFKTDVVFQYRDTGTELHDKGYSQCHICVLNETYRHEKIFNQFLTLVVPKIGR